jgi:hypothetical protein
MCEAFNFPSGLTNIAHAKTTCSMTTAVSDEVVIWN